MAVEGLEPVDILLVDDRPSNLMSLRGVLERADYNLILASTGEEALSKVLRHDFAVILMDVAMPGMDGFEAAELIKRRERSRRVPIIFVTASVTEMHDVIRGYSTGAVDYLQKPVEGFAVRAKVAVFVELYRQRQQIERQSARLRESERQERELQFTRLRLESERRYRNRLSMENNLAALLSEAETLEDVGGRALQVMAHGLGWDAATLWRPDRGGRLMRPGEVWASDDLGAGPLLEATQTSRFGLGEGLVGQVWMSGDAVWAGDLSEDARFIRAEQADQQAFQSGLWVPVPSGREVVAVIELLSRPLRERDEECVSACKTLASQVGLFMQRSAARSALRASEERLRLLAEAGAALLGSLDPEEGLAAVVKMVVPRFADCCIIDLQAAGQFRRAAAAHVDTEKQLMLREMQCPLASHQEVVEGVVESGVSRFLRDIHPDGEGPLQDLGLRSALVIPLQARDRILGSMLLGAGSQRRFAEADMATAEELGRRVGVAVENAGLFADAQAAVRIRDEFLSVASHELRTPLSSLLLQLEGLHRRLRRTKLNDEGDRLGTKLETALRQTGRLANLIDNLLDVSRISTGRLALQAEACDLADVVRDVVERFRDEAEAAGCEIVMKVDRAVSGRWDRLRLEQVVTNLLTNAIKYGRGQPVELEVASTEDGASFSVRDQGIGIASDNVARIFDRFERAVSMRHYGGLGLGLYISRQIVEAHGGSISVKSEPGTGSVFLVAIPREPPPESLAQVVGPG
jgi:signal transduction histidine kinase/CheY-like chemotaxis protein